MMIRGFQRIGFKKLFPAIIILLLSTTAFADYVKGVSKSYLLDQYDCLDSSGIKRHWYDKTDYTRIFKFIAHYHVKYYSGRSRTIKVWANMAEDDNYINTLNPDNMVQSKAYTFYYDPPSSGTYDLYIGSNGVFTNRSNATPFEWTVNLSSTSYEIPRWTDQEWHPYVSIDDNGYDEKTGHSSSSVDYIQLYRTISGYVKTSGGSSVSGVTMKRWPGSNPVTNSNGYYVGSVEYGWSGTITPSKSGSTFIPTSKSYSNVVSNKSNENYTVPSPSTISGYVRTSSGSGLSGVTMTGWPGADPVTSSSGRYSGTVGYYWSGIIRPSRTGYRFSPSIERYSNVKSNKTKNYTGSLKILVFFILLVYF